VSVPTAIDLFCGCGGFSTGLLDAGVRVLAGFDSYAPALVAYNYNHEYRGARGHLADLAEVTGARLLELAGSPSVDLVVGGPPCQAFSIVGKRRGLGDPRGRLVFDFARLVAELRPKAVLLENVPGLLAADGGRIFARVRAGLEEAGYNVRAEVLHAADYGVPQMRRRTFVAGVRMRGSFPYPPPPTHSAEPFSDLFGSSTQAHVSARQALADLPDVGTRAGRRIPNHEPTHHSAPMLLAFADLQPGKRDPKSFHDRLHPDRPGYTLRAGDGNFTPLRPIHYRYDRVVSVRESARLQGFADTFVWPDSLPRLQQYRQVGNAVAPPVAKALATHLAGILGWRLDPEGLCGDPDSRAAAATRTPEERDAERRSRIRGASLGAG